MPNRLLKDSICTSEKISGLSDFHFRLWTYLITYVDDYGRGDARAAIIKGRCFPLRDRVTARDIDAGLHVLADTGCILLYDVDGESYLCFPNWDKHQIIRNKQSKYPEPPKVESNCRQLNAIESNCKQMQANVSVIQSNPNTNPNPKEYGGRFAPPTREQVADYCRERQNKVDVDRFLDYYTSNGWRVGKNPMKDWRAAVRTWERGDSGCSGGGQPKKVVAQMYEQREYSAEPENDGLPDFLLDVVRDKAKRGEALEDWEREALAKEASA